tara:strand:+ start:285 stop:671 length:387 start_codon:yes stop_codon:yes gene_type:complete
MENKIEFSIQDLVITIATPISFIIAGFIIFGIIYWAFFSSLQSKNVFWSLVLAYTTFGLIIYLEGHWVVALIGMVVVWIGYPVVIESIFSKKILKESQAREKTFKAYQKLVAEDIRKEKRKRRKRRRK